MHYAQLAMRIVPRQRALRAAAVLIVALHASSNAASAQGRRSTEPWRIVTPPQSTQVFARDGSLIGELGTELRTSVPLRTLPRYLAQAFIAVEDQRFYQHDGVDVIGIAGAIKDNIMGDRRGASTITQQLVGNMHPGIIDRTDRTLDRKLREQQAAREMEKRYSKQQILEAYLNQVSFGRGYHGVESAARHYFGKPASRVSIAEAAALAAIVNGPAIYDPVRHPDRVRQRRNVVLALMAQQGFISQAQARAAQATSVRTVPNAGYAVSAPYFVHVVRVQAQRAGVAVRQGGYRIYTSLDPALQTAATTSLAEVTEEIESRPGYRHPRYSGGARNSEYLQGAVIAMDPLTGDVRALVGGRDYADSEFDRAIDAKRQPGSAFKPIVYAAALMDSVAPTTFVADTAIAIRLENGSVYRPDNSDNEYLGMMTLREALAKSRNVVAVQLGMQVGLDSIATLARRLGIQSPVAPYPSSAIGASVVQPLDLVAAYSAFATLGTPVEPRFIHRIEDAAGRPVYTGQVRTHPLALDPRVAFVVRDMMRDVVERGTATSIRRFIPRSVPVAGKTGTTNDNTDVWFVGLTPDIVAGVWLGFDRPKTITPGAAGGSLAAPVFGRMLSRYYARAGVPRNTWDQPPVGVISAEADRATGQIATDATPPARRYTEFWVEGTEPPALRADPWAIIRAGVIAF